MTDWLSPEQRSRNMSSIRSQGNASTEQKFIRLLRAGKISGWRRHQNLPGKPDFTFRKKRLAVFVDGCFWHGCPKCYRLPKDNRAYWKKKVESNRCRDRRVGRKLRETGWSTLRFWEHSLKTPDRKKRALARLKKALSSRK